MRRSLIALIVPALLALAACSSSAATSAPTAAPATAAPATAAPATAAPATAAPATAAPASAAAGAGQKVSIKNFAFNPASVTAALGEKITWTNGDDAQHTVTFDDASVGGSGNLNNGSSFDLTIGKAGTYTYHCKIHPSMKGTVIIS